MSQSQKRGRWPHRTLRLHPVHRPDDGTLGSEPHGSARTRSFLALIGIPFQSAIMSASGRSGVLARPAECRPIDPHAMQDDGKLASERDKGTLVAAAFGDLHCPAPERGHSC
jgi:hypothetical protein